MASGPFVDAALASELEMVCLNVTVLTRLAHTFVRRIRNNGRGGIVLMGSILGRQGVPGVSCYAATKAYVRTLAEGFHQRVGALRDRRAVRGGRSGPFRFRRPSGPEIWFSRHARGGRSGRDGCAGQAHSGHSRHPRAVPGGLAGAHAAPTAHSISWPRDAPHARGSDLRTAGTPPRRAVMTSHRRMRARPDSLQAHGQRTKDPR
jgi:hypothetical protein